MITTMYSSEVWAMIIFSFILDNSLWFTPFSDCFFRREDGAKIERWLFFYTYFIEISIWIGLLRINLLAVTYYRKGLFRFWTLLCIAVHSCTVTRGIDLPSVFLSPPHFLHAIRSRMAHSSNVFIHESTINSAQGDIHINNRDSGMHEFRPGSVHKSIFINDPIKDFVTWN